MIRKPASLPAIQTGQTLAELLAVLSIMAIVLLLAYPATAPVKVSAVDAATKEVTEALRFAQADAIRTGAYRVVSFDLANQKIRVYGLILAPKQAPVEDTANPVNHPLDKKIYSVAVDSLPGNAGVVLWSAAFTFSGSSASVPQVTFAANGTPVNLTGANPTVAMPMTSSGTVAIRYSGFQRTVTVDADTGRVTAPS